MEVQMRPGDMNALFNPKTIALIGATDVDGFGRQVHHGESYRVGR